MRGRHGWVLNTLKRTNQMAGKQCEARPFSFKGNDLYMANSRKEKNQDGGRHCMTPEPAATARFFIDDGENLLECRSSISELIFRENVP